MAKTIFIIEDIDIKTASIDVKVLRFNTPDEADTPAILLGAGVELALSTLAPQYGITATFVPMQSAARH